MISLFGCSGIIKHVCLCAFGVFFGVPSLKTGPCVLRDTSERCVCVFVCMHVCVCLCACMCVCVGVHACVRVLERQYEENDDRIIEIWHHVLMFKTFSPHCLSDEWERDRLSLLPYLYPPDTGQHMRIHGCFLFPVKPRPLYIRGLFIWHTSPFVVPHQRKESVHHKNPRFVCLCLAYFCVCVVACQVRLHVKVLPYQSHTHLHTHTHTASLPAREKLSA